MRAVFALLLVLALPLQTEIPSQGPAHGPYADKEGWICSRVDTNEAAKNVQCACKMPCENHGMLDRSCQTYCVEADKCKCHLDQSCDMPDVTPRPK